MRLGFNNQKILLMGNVFIGISLGYDQVAEHEGGISGLRKKLLIDKSKLGLEGRMIQDNKYVIFKQDEKFTLLMTYSRWRIEEAYDKSLEDCIPYDMKMDENLELQTAWDSDDFAIMVSNKSKEYVKYLHELHHAFLKMDIAITMLAGVVPAFENSSMCVIIASKLPMAEREALENADRKVHDLVAYEEKIGMKELKDRARLSYYNGDKKNGKYWLALYPHWINYEDTAKARELKRMIGTTYDIRYWTNYADDETYGWFTVEEVRQWLETPGARLNEIHTKFNAKLPQ